MKSKTTFKRPLVLEENFEYVDIGGGFYAYQYSLVLDPSLKHTSQAKNLVDKKYQGIVNKCQLEKYLKGNLSVSEFEPGLYVIGEKLLKLVQKKGFQELYEESNELQTLNGPSQFEQALTGAFNGSDIYKVNWGDHEILTSEGEPVAQAIWFDYLNGYIHDGNYDLRSLLDHLKTRADILAVNPKTHADLEMLSITEIPYYNQDEDQSNQLCFYYMPTDSEFKKICEFKKENKNYVGLQEATIALDILGLKQFRVTSQRKDY